MNTQTDNHPQVAPPLHPFVLLQSVESGNKFFSTNNEGDPTKSATGETWYRILGYADSIVEAQRKLYGRSFPLPRSAAKAGESPADTEKKEGLPGDLSKYGDSN